MTAADASNDNATFTALIAFFSYSFLPADFYRALQRQNKTLQCVPHALTLASVGSVVPVSRSALFAVWPVDSGLTGAPTALRIARLYEGGRGVAVAMTATGAQLEAE